MAKVWTSAAVAVLMSFACAARAEIYQYHPETTLKLGGGFDPQRPRNAALTCLDGTPHPIENTTVSANFNATVIHSRQELLKILHVDASLSGRYGLYSGGASFSYDSEYSFDEDSLTWAIYADVDYGRIDLQNPKPNAYAQSLINSHDWQQFISGCGTEVVTTERRKGSVAAIFSVHNLSTSEKQDLEAKANFGASAGVWSASASASYHSFVSQASELSTIKVSVAVVGGGGIQILSGLATDYDDLQKVSDIVKNYINSINFSNAAPAEYDTTDWAAFGYNGSIVDVTKQSAVLADLYIKYQDTQRARDRAHDLYTQAQQPVYQGRLTADQLTSLLAEQNNSDKTIDVILTRADACRKSVALCTVTTDIQVPSIPWPSLAPIDHYQVLTYSLSGCNPGPGQVSGGCYTQVQVDITFDTSVVQSINFYAQAHPIAARPAASHLIKRKGRPDPVALKGSWTSQVMQFQLMGVQKAAFMVVKDKAGIDTIYSLSLTPDY